MRWRCLSFGANEPGNRLRRARSRGNERARCAGGTSGAPGADAREPRRGRPIPARRLLRGPPLQRRRALRDRAPAAPDGRRQVIAPPDSGVEVRSETAVFVLPEPSATLDLAMDDGAPIRVVRHGSPFGTARGAEPRKRLRERFLLPVLAADAGTVRPRPVRLSQLRAKLVPRSRVAPLSSLRARQRGGARRDCRGMGREDHYRRIPLDVGDRRPARRRRRRLALGRAGAVRSARWSRRTAVHSAARW